MEKLLYDYEDYRDFLKDTITSMPRKGRGKKKELALAIQAQTTHISQVLSKKTHLTLEQGLQACQFFHLDENSTDFFMALINFSRAGTIDLRNYYGEEMKRMKKAHQWSKKKLREEKIIDEKEREIYYSAWYYPVIHVMLSIPKFQSIENIVKYLPLEEKLIWDAVNFLLRCGLAKRKGSKVIMGEKSIQFERGSRDYRSFLKNLKGRSLLSIDRGFTEDLHSAFVVSVSNEDRAKIRDILVKSIEKIGKIVEASQEEDAYILSLDFFLV